MIELPIGVAVAPATEHPELLAQTTQHGISELVAHNGAAADITVFEIDPELADTAALTQAYQLDPAVSANCVLVAGSRGGQERIAACLVLATTKADVNKTVRKLLDVRKASFLPMARAVKESGMEYGGIGPIGLPSGYRLLIDARVAATEQVVIGSGVRHSKLIVPGPILADIPGSQVIEGLANALPSQD